MNSTNQQIRSPATIAFSWLLLLRWGALACQALLILAVSLIFEIRVPVLIVSIILAFQGGSNLYFLHLKKRETIKEWLLSLVMFLDVTLLTFLLHYTGGPMNPFTFLYLVHIVLGAILMRPKWSWGLTFFTVLCYAVFFLPDMGVFAGSSNSAVGQGLIDCHQTLNKGFSSQSNMKIHLQGMWLAFSITALFIVFFVGRIQRALEKNEQALVHLKEEKVRNEKLASLATLAAGAAHEFSTPLSTIAVAAGEMLHFLKKREGQPELIADVVLIRQQVAQCKEILFQMAADAGEHLGEPLEEIGLSRLLGDVLDLLPPENVGQIVVNNTIGDFNMMVPSRTIKRAVKGLLKNAIDASADGSPITLTCRKDSEFLFFEVKDEGEGMDSETLLKACEPFYTTKAPGKGLGLGLYLAKSVAEKFGGNLRLVSQKGQGATVVLSLRLKYIQ